MSQTPQHARPQPAPKQITLPAAEILIDLEADNVLLRAALARSEGAGVRRDLIARELTHRIGNLLAVVQAIARQTFSSADPVSRDDFGARIHALAAAQKLLIDSEARAANLAAVVRDALEPHCVDGQRCTITGPELALGGRRAHAITLALHELATNAAKYGALSVEHGWVDVSWTVQDERLDFLWREREGPAVMAPERRGFGSLLITRNLGLAFGGVVDLAFETAGVECRLSAPAHPAA